MSEWDDLRQHFPVVERWAFLDHAAVAPLPLPAQRAMAEWADDVGRNGVVSEPRWRSRIEETRCLAARLLGAKATDVAFVKNTSEGIGIVAEGYPWRPGDNVVITADEYPANVYPWMNLATRGVNVLTVAGRQGRYTVDDFRAVVDGHTRLISVSAVQFATGFRMDLESLGAFCRERGIHFFVDAIQALGVLPFDVERAAVDFLSADSHKWMLGPEGAGILYVRGDLVEHLRPVGIGWNSVENRFDFSRIDFRLRSNAGRWESGALNVAGVVAMGASLELLLGLGIDRVCQRVFDLTDYLCEQAGRADLEVYSRRLASQKSGIVSLVPQGDARDVAKRCREAGVAVAPRAGRVRVSPHCYNAPAELDRLIGLLKRTDKVFG